MVNDSGLILRWPKLGIFRLSLLTTSAYQVYPLFSSSGLFHASLTRAEELYTRAKALARQWGVLRPLRIRQRRSETPTCRWVKGVVIYSGCAALFTGMVIRRRGPWAYALLAVIAENCLLIEQSYPDMLAGLLQGCVSLAVAMFSLQLLSGRTITLSRLGDDPLRSLR